MARIAENTVIVDGQEYKPGDVIPDFKSIKCVDTREPRKYQGLSADVSVLNDVIAKYASGGASCFMSDTGEYYEYDRKEKTWKLITNITERGFDSEKAYGALKHMLKNVTVSDEKIQSAVTNYLTVNPVLPGATTEQAQQIEQNKTDVAALKEETGSLKEDLDEQKFYKKQTTTDNILLGINGNGTIVSDKNCTVITSNKNIAIVTGSFSTDVQYGSPIQIDRRNIKAGKRYYVSFDTENTGCECQIFFDFNQVKKFVCDGTRKQLDIFCSEYNSSKRAPLIQVAVGGVQSGLFTNVQIEEEKFTSYVEHKGEEINLNANIIKNFSIYAAYTSVWCSDNSANIEITYQVNGVHYIDGKVSNIVSKFPNLKGKKVVTYGDSLFASGNDTNDYSWQKVVCESLGIENHIGVSIGGSGFCWNPNRRYTYPSNFVLGDNLPVGCFISSDGASNANFCSWDRISKTIPKDADVVIIGTGTNDIGSMSSDLAFRTVNIQDTDWVASSEYSKYGGDFNTGGVRGAIMSTIMKIHCQAPNADIYLTNWCNSRGDNGTNNQTNTSRETETMAMLEDMEYASKNAGVPLFDLFHNSGINPLNRSDYVIDIIHLNTKGYKKMGNVIACAIKSLIN